MSPSSSTVLRLGTRGSLLAKTQSRLVADQLMAAHPGLTVELHVIKTTGDRITDKPLHEFGGKGLFTKELEQALLEGEVDFAVHSYKDVPVTQPLVGQENLVIAAVPPREDPRDVAACRDPARAGFGGGLVVGTTSLRRRCQVLQAAPDARIETLRGNIDTRLRKLREGQYDMILLALAGLKRAGLFDPSYMRPLDTDVMLPSPGQGALALQCRADDARTRELLSALNDPATAAAVLLERSVVRRLGGDCHSPIAALASYDVPGHVRLRVAAGGRDGVPPVLRAEAQHRVSVAPRLVDDTLKHLEAQGVRQALHRGESID
jgi:hydroxymethylbilane synthase